MTAKTISIVTSCGGSLGYGHLQRMMSLAWFLRKKKSVDAYIVINGERPSIPGEIKSFVIPDIHPLSSLIIRDMRDSGQDEIERLMGKWKTIVIDDMGPGRNSADFSINLLPAP